MPKQTTPTSKSPATPPADTVGITIASNDQGQVALLFSVPTPQLVFDIEGAKRLASNLTAQAEIAAKALQKRQPAKKSGKR